MDVASLEKLFEPFAAVTIKGMFGGRGVHADGLVSALQAGDDICLKTASSRSRFSEAGSRPFVYRSPTGLKETSYWPMPKAGSGDAQALKTWRRLALDAARRAAATKEANGGREFPRKKRRRPTALLQNPARRGAAREFQPDVA